MLSNDAYRENNKNKGRKTFTTKYLLYDIVFSPMFFKFY